MAGVESAPIFTSAPGIRSISAARRRPKASTGRYDRLKDVRVPLAKAAQTVRENLKGEIDRVNDLALAEKNRGEERIRQHRRAAELERRLVRTCRQDRITTGLVVDPWGDGRETTEVVINRKVDLLEEERSHKHISEAAYRTGRHVQAVLERSTRIASSNWEGASRIDPTTARDAKAVRLAENAKEAAALEARIRQRLGMIGTRLLRRILGDGLSYAQCACLQGKSGERGVYYVRMRFREALEDLAEAFAAKGNARPAPDDEYAEAAPAVPQRQAAAIAGGATRRRYTEELRAALVLGMTAPTPRERREATRDVDVLVTRLAFMGGEAEG